LVTKAAPANDAAIGTLYFMLFMFLIRVFRFRCIDDCIIFVSLIIQERWRMNVLTPTMAEMYVALLLRAFKDTC
jgi:hypothetical protein